MLVGREDECRDLARLLRDAANGTSGSLVIRAEAGMGKTALLEFARAEARTFLIASAKGIESESELAFAALVGICRPLTAFLPRLPKAQREALDAAIATTAAPVVNPLTVFAGLLTLVGTAAEVRPILILVDDIQWIDRSSMEAILFVARRLGRDRVAVLMASRPHDDDVADLDGIPAMTLGGLGPEAGVRLLRTVARAATIAEDVAERLVELTGGTPLALVEVPSLLAGAQLRGDERLPEPLPAGDAIRKAFQKETAGVSRRTMDGLRVLAADDAGALDVVQDALERLHVSLAVLEPAESRGLIRISEGHGEFRHPLLRSVVYHGSTPGGRRRAHAALACAYASRDIVRHAWHRAAAATGPDEVVASALEAAAGDAMARGGHGPAATALERAAELAPARVDQARRRYHAGVAASLGGQALRAQRNLDVALGLATDPLLRADVQRARGHLLYAGASLRNAFALLLDEAVRIQDIAPERAVAMLTDACTVCSGSADVAAGMKAGRLAMAVARRADRESQFLAALALAQPLTLSGHTRQAQRLLRKWKGFAVTYFEPPLMRPFDPIAGTAYTYEDHAFGRRLLDTIHESARTRAPEMLPQVLATLSHVEIQAGDWLLALAHSTEGAELATVLGQGGTRSFALATLATVEAGMGREDARAHVHAAIDVAARTATRSMHAYGLHALGVLELGLGRASEAIPPLEETGRLMREWGTADPYVIPWMPNLVEAYVHAGMPSAASALTSELAERANQTGMPWARAVVARCTGLLAIDFDGPFRESLALFEGLPTAFDRARTELAYAERLRRVGRRNDARRHLHAAIGTFRRLGAAPWTARAEAELGGTAEHHRARRNPVEELSPQELQVALLVGEGKTNRETAVALFVTAKTVEYHLGNVYQKLGIRSRTELARLMATRGSSQPSR